MSRSALRAARLVAFSGRSDPRAAGDRSVMQTGAFAPDVEVCQIGQRRGGRTCVPAKGYLSGLSLFVVVEDVLVNFSVESSRKVPDVTEGFRTALASGIIGRAWPSTIVPLAYPTPASQSASLRLLSHSQHARHLIWIWLWIISRRQNSRNSPRL